MTKHTVKTIASGEYSCSCGLTWDRDEGSECPNSGSTSETPAQLGTRLHAEMQEAIENSAKMRQPLEEIAERAAFEGWYETTYGISLEPEFRANHFICYVNDKANHRWTAWQARAALSAPSHGEQVRDCEDWSVFVGYLIDNCEGHPVAEENLQGWLADMIADPHYGALFRREKTADGKPVDHNLPIAMAIEAAEGEHGSLRATAKALGIDASYLSRLKSGEKLNPGDDVLSALGLERVTMYRAAAPLAGGANDT